jgi:hypothetical protein
MPVFLMMVVICLLPSAVLGQGWTIDEDESATTIEMALLSGSDTKTYGGGVIRTLKGDLDVSLLGDWTQLETALGNIEATAIQPGVVVYPLRVKRDNGYSLALGGDYRKVWMTGEALDRFDLHAEGDGWRVFAALFGSVAPRNHRFVKIVPSFKAIYAGAAARVEDSSGNTYSDEGENLFYEIGVAFIEDSGRGRFFLRPTVTLDPDNNTSTWGISFGIALGAGRSSRRSTGPPLKISSGTQPVHEVDQQREAPLPSRISYETLMNARTNVPESSTLESSDLLPDHLDALGQIFGITPSAIKDFAWGRAVVPENSPLADTSWYRVTVGSGNAQATAWVNSYGEVVERSASGTD